MVQVFVALTLIGFILIQHGKGADAGAAFGSGASGTVFGSQGSGNFFDQSHHYSGGDLFLANSLALRLFSGESFSTYQFDRRYRISRASRKRRYATDEAWRDNSWRTPAEEAEARGENLDAALPDTWDPATTVECRLKNPWKKKPLKSNKT